jgi:hypothetical protein
MSSDLISEYCEHFPIVSIDMEGNIFINMTTEQLQKWIMTIPSLQNDISKYTKIISDECIDGKCFNDMSDREFLELGFDCSVRHLFRSFINGQKKQLITAPCSQTIATPNLEIPSVESSDLTYGQLVVLGYRVSHYFYIFVIQYIF